MNYSHYQSAIFEFCQNGTGNGIIQACAGSGKTTTIIEASKRIKGRSLFLAFNKSIANELIDRGVNASTFHSVCFKSIRDHLNIKNVDSDKLFKIMKNELNYNQRQIYGNAIKRLIGLGKQMGVGIYNDYTYLGDILINYDINCETGNVSELLSLSEHIFRVSINDTFSVDYDDMLYYIIKYDVPMKTYPIIFVDELQDLNLIQRYIVQKMTNSKTRVIGVGDRFQACYRFRGADSNAMDKFKDMFNCTEFPLSITYRCPKLIVEYAQLYNPLIEAPLNAPQGLITHVKDLSLATLRSSDFVVCRTSRELIGLAYKCLHERIPVTVLGRDIGTNLKNLIKKHTKSNDINDLYISLEHYLINEVLKYKRLGQESKIESITDKVQTIQVLIDSLPMDKKTVPDLINVIDGLFKERKNAVIFSTIHKAKGLEANRIFWLSYNKCPAKWAKSDEDLQQEKNLCYIAITRAKKELFLVLG